MFIYIMFLRFLSGCMNEEFEDYEKGVEDEARRRAKSRNSN